MVPMEKAQAQQRIKELEEICEARPTALMVADLAACYFTDDRPQKALPLMESAFRRMKVGAVGMNLALVYKDLGRHDEALKTLEEAYGLDPDNAYLQLGYAEGLLKAGFWKIAWPLYDNARPTQQGAAFDLRLPPHVREWNGEQLPAGSQVLVINEGGVGDRISYARWLPELTRRGINWKFYPYSVLFSMFSRVFPRDRLVADGDQLNPTHWTTTFALPAKLNIGPSEIPPPLKFTALPEKIEQYKKYPLIKEHKKPLVGICYKAAELFQGGRTVRSLSKEQAMRIVNSTSDDVQWVNLQFGESMDFPVFNPRFETWEDTAGLIENLDAVVTVDTGIMHLVGALGKKMAVLLPGNSCWKFLRQGKYLPLYPTATFFRNDGKHGFEEVIDELIDSDFIL